MWFKNTCILDKCKICTLRNKNVISIIIKNYAILMLI